jgi:hypothetical protein
LSGLVIRTSVPSIESNSVESSFRTSQVYTISAMSKIRSDHALTANGYGVGEHGSSSHIFEEHKSLMAAESE